MKGVIIFVVVAICAAAVFSSPSDLKDLKKQKQAAKACTKSCDTVEFKAICAAEGKEKPKSFGNECVLQNHNCEHSTHLVKISDGECPGGGGIRLS